MIYFIINVLQNLLQFVQLLHMEDFFEDSSFLSPNQVNLLFTVLRNLLGYFGLYSISGELDSMIMQKDGLVDAWKHMLLAIIAIELAFVI